MPARLEAGQGESLVPNIVEQVIMNASKRGRQTLLEPEAKDVCIAYGIPTPKFRVVQSASEAVRYMEEVTPPVVLKIVSPDILHKTEAGGVIIGLKSKEQVEDAYDQILLSVKQHAPDARVEGILVQSMVPSGVEVIVGGLRDSQFGPTVLFGLGGVFVEVLKDASFRVAPVTELDTRQMVEEIRGYPLLRGVRGRPASDEKAIIQILQAASKIMLEIGQIAQLDLNPVIVHPKGATVVDARIILG
jgi:acetate---CoA ligase (ADP-forming) subunit beta